MNGFLAPFFAGKGLNNHFKVYRIQDLLHAILCLFLPAVQFFYLLYNFFIYSMTHGPIHVDLLKQESRIHYLRILNFDILYQIERNLIL